MGPLASAGPLMVCYAGVVSWYGPWWMVPVTAPPASADPRGGQVRRAIQVLSIALMTAGLLLDNSLRCRDRRAGGASDKDATGRRPLLLFWIGAVLLVLSSI